MRVKVKICGLTNPTDAEFAQEQGADFLGFVHASKSKRQISPADLEWIQALSKPKVAVFADLEEAPSDIFDIVQAEGELLERIFWKVVRLKETDTVQSVLAQLGSAPTLVLDAYHPNLPGGTGQTIDWDLAASIVAACPVSVVLAGGLTAENVAEAVYRVRPWAVDVSSGVESELGKKDPHKVAAFVQAAKAVQF